MKNDRLGDWLWEEWDGDGLESQSELIYSTNGWVELSNEIVRRALASCLQREGVADSLSDGFRMVENGNTIMTYIGIHEGEKTPTVCDEFGESELGEVFSSTSKITLVEL